MSDIKDSNRYCLKLFHAQSGALSARLEHDNGKMIHLHSTVKPEDEGRYYEELNIWGDRIIFLGSGLGYHIEAIVGRIPPGSSVILIDFYDELVRLCKEKYFPGEEVNAISSESLDKDQVLKSFLLGGRYVQVIKHPASYSVNREFYDGLLSSIRSGVSGKGSGTALVLYGKFFLQEELCTALEKNNFKAVRFEYDKADTSLKYESELQYLIQKEKPEFVLSVNMLGFDGSGVLGEICWNSGIPLAAWFVDDPNPVLLHQEQFLKKNMTAFCWERTYLPKLSELNFDKAYYLPLATDPGMFSYSTNRRMVAGAGFVGSSMGKKFLGDIAGKFLWTESLEPLVLTCASMLLADPFRDVDGILEEVCGRDMMKVPYSDRRNRTWLRSYIIHTASMMRRKQVIAPLVSSGIQTFGDPEGWRDLCGDNLKTNPDIDYRTELSQTYRNIEINVNITSCQMPSAVNQRVFDIPSCGGFVISDMQDDLKEIFESDEVAVYSSVEELREKVEYFRINEKEREEISGRARARILKEHTYAKRLETIMKMLSIR